MNTPLKWKMVCAGVDINFYPCSKLGFGVIVFSSGSNPCLDILCFLTGVVRHDCTRYTDLIVVVHNHRLMWGQKEGKWNQYNLLKCFSWTIWIFWCDNKEKKKERKIDRKTTLTFNLFFFLFTFIYELGNRWALLKIKIVIRVVINLNILSLGWSYKMFCFLNLCSP